MASGRKSEGNRRRFEVSKAQLVVNPTEILLQKKLPERQHIVGMGVREDARIQQFAPKCRAQCEAKPLFNVAHFERQNIENLGIRRKV